MPPAATATSLRHRSRRFAAGYRRKVDGTSVAMHDDVGLGRNAYMLANARQTSLRGMFVGGCLCLIVGAVLLNGGFPIWRVGAMCAAFVVLMLSHQLLIA